MSAPTTTDHVARLKRAMATIERAHARIAELEQERHEPVAIIGMACRFPAGASDPSALWQALLAGVDGVREAPAARWGAEPPREPGVRWAATLDDVTGLDAEHFGISPREAVRLDPQQRLLLEVSWEALEAAGVPPEQLAGTRTGVFVGITTLDYQQRVLEQPLDIHSVTGTALCFAAGRLSYVLGLQGPSVSFDTACSSSLVAVHQACQSLRAGESELALVGGVNLMLSPTTTRMLAQALSPSGRCMSFDARANGYVRGEGCGVVVLKRLGAAERDGDRILAVVRGSAVNHDGRSTGLTAPNVLSQQRLLRQALASARVRPEQVGYVETHGTGTPLGDPIEVEALRAVLGAPRPDGERCWLGAIKTNLGHLEAAAGIAGLIKAVLVLEREAIPANLHFEALNPMISLDGTPLAIPTATVAWPRGAAPRIAGVSSFGMSGTNAHVVLEEAPREPDRAATPERSHHLLVLSARSESALRGEAERHAAYLRTTSAALADVCHTAAVGRAQREHRLALVSPDAGAAAAALEAFVAGRVGSELAVGRAVDRPRLAFLFTGQGSQHVGMGRALLATEPVFRAAMERCAAILDEQLPRPLLRVLYEPTADEAGLVDQTEYTQPLLVALEWSLAQLWASWGVVPDVVMGHSVGEYAAAIVAGVLALEDGLRLVARRGRLVQTLPAGGVMLSVSAGAELVDALVAEHGGGEAAVAAYNGPRSVVVSGSDRAVGRVLAALERQGVQATRLPVSHAFHSPLVEPMLEGLASALAEVSLRPARVELVTNVTGRVAGSELVSPEHWIRHTRAPVQLARGMAELQRRGCEAFVEIGPQPTLLGLGRACLPELAHASWVPSLRRNRDDLRVLLAGAGELWSRGVPVDLRGLDRPHHRRRVELPAHAWQRQRHFIDWTADEPRTAGKAAAASRGGTSLVERRADGPGHGIHFVAQLDAARHPYLEDHRVLDQRVVPGAVLAATLLAAVEQAVAPGSAGLVLEDLVLPQALVLDGPTSLHAVLAPTDAGAPVDGALDRLPRPVTLEARLSSPLALEAGTSWRTHAIARLHAAAAAEPAGVRDLAELRARLPVDREAARSAYESLAQVGLRFGPAFRSLDAIGRGEGEALARLRAATAEVETGLGPLHPCVLDACFQAFGAALPVGSGAVVLPFGLARLRLHARPQGELWCHARVRPEPAGDAWIGDVELVQADGRVVATLEGYRARAVSTSQLAAASHAAPSPYHAIAWRASDAPTAAVRAGRRWLVLTDRGGLGRAIARGLEATGERCIEVAAATRYEALGPSAFTVDPAQARDLARVLAEVGHVDGVVHLWGLDDAASDVALGCGGALALCHALTGRDGAPPRLWLVTRGAQAVRPGPVACNQAALWGLGRVLAAEHPELGSVLVDLDPAAADAAACLHAELTAAASEPQVAWRAGRRWVPRLVEHVPVPRRTALVRSDATYLVTGGWGALGLHVAGWLADQGARRLVLAGRTAPRRGEAVAAIAALRAREIEVQLVEADVARAADVERLITACMAGPWPLRGVIHAAGVLDDGLLRDLSLARVVSVLGPKLVGAINLEAALRSSAVALDWLVSFSSAAAVTGPAGQGGYAAANAALDAFAHDRRAAGLPVTSIGWGPWQGDGMAADARLQRRFVASGLQPLAPSQGLEGLARVLAADEPHVVVLPGRWTHAGAIASERPGAERPASRPEPRRGSDSPAPGATPTDPAALRGRVRDLASRVLGLASSTMLDEARPLAELGLDSLMAVELRDVLAELVGRPLPATIVFDHPTVAALAEHLAPRLAPEPASAPAPEPAAVAAIDDAIAIVGMGCRFPGGADDPAAYWQLLVEGRDAIREVPPDRWDLDALYDPDPEAPGKMYTRWGGFLDGVDRFDAKFFGITPREATSMDPQQRLLLEVSWEALEHAGLAPEGLVGANAGVFMGIMFNDYAQRITCEPTRIDAWFGTGNATSVASGRVSYQLGLKGPSVTLDTACSSSLVSVHLACQSLRTGETDLALAGGATVVLSPAGNVYFSRAHALARDGRCKSFSAAADGVVWSEGCGVVVLERLSDALAQGHRVLAVIRGSAVNQDGRSNGLSAPNGPSQVAVIERALHRAGLSPAAIDYVEAHGTGTPLGDPVEAHALDAALGRGRPVDRPLLVSAVKSSFGHTQAAAGVAGLIKAVLALQHGIIPPTLHGEPPSPHVDWSRLRLVTEPCPWPTSDAPRRAGVSSFGISGTNAHVVLEQAPREPAPVRDEADQLLLLSARSERALQELAARYRAHLEVTTDALADVCHTAAVGRSAFEHRLAVVAEHGRAAAEALAAFVAGRPAPTVVHGRVARRPTLAFLFTGQGSQHVGMGRGLLEHEPVFREAMRRCAAVLDPVLPRPMLEVLYPPPGAAAPDDALDRTLYTQPLLVALEWSLTELWRSWGVEPDVVMGHSVGEYAAAIVAGVTSLEDGLRLVAARARRMQALPEGGVMAAVHADPAWVEEAIAEHGGGRVAVAAYNGPRSVVVAGQEEAASRVLEALARRGVTARRLVVSHAFHSPSIEPMLAGFAEDLAGVSLRPPRIPLVSNLSGALASDELAAADHWLRHTREPVAFARGMEALLERGCDAFVEIGPQPTLLGLGRACTPSPEAMAWLPSLRRGQPDRRTLLLSRGELHVRGAGTAARLPSGPGRRRVALPTYPWQKQRFWIDERPVPSAAVMPAGGHPLLGARVELAHDPDAQLWQSTLDVRRLAYLRDHQVEGEIVMPGTAYLELVLAAVAELGEPGPHELLAVRNHRAMVLAGDEPRVVQLVITRGDAGERSFRVSSRPAGDASRWQLHCSGRLRHAHAEPLVPVAAEAVREIQARCPRTIDAAEFYARLAERGNHWGPAFQGIQQLWCGEGEVLARIEAPLPIASALASYRFHPALSDACGHAFAALQAFDDASASPGGAFVGAGARAARIHAAPRGRTLWSHARVRPAEALAPAEPAGGEPANVLVADIRILDEDGALVAELQGARFWYLEPGLRAPTTRDWLYELAWEPQARPAEASHAREASTWIVVDDGRGLADALAAELESRGDACVRVVVATDGVAALDEHPLRVRPDAVEDFAGVLERVAARGLPPCRGVVHAWHPGSPLADEASLAALADARASVAALSLVRALAALPRTRPRPRLWLVTRGAQAVSDGDVIAPEQAPLWGIGGVVSQEHPELWGGLVDLDPRGRPRPRSGEAEVVRLVDELRAEPCGEQVALRGDARHVARLSRWRVPTDPVPPLAWHADASYLVTGGLGDLGLAVARWMVDRGARHLVLAGRTALPPRSEWDALATASDPASGRSRAAAAVAAIRALEERGATVRVAVVDVADGEALARLFETHRRERWPPIRGVVHAAGVVSPGPLAAIEPASLRAVLRPKTVGGWQLHRQLAATPLDFMVLFSSASALLPSPLLGGYPAANAFLDALAHHRRRHGLPAISIDWGPWAEVGMAAGRGPSEAAPRGAGTIPVAEGLELLGLLMQRGPARVGVLPMDWAAWRQTHREAASAPLYARVLAEVPAEAEGAARSDDAAALGIHVRGRDLAGASPHEREALMLELLREQVARIARLDPSEIGVDVPLSELGLDSLMAVELRQAVERAVGVSLPLVHFLSAPSITALAATLCGELPLAPAATAGGSAPDWEEGEL